jgi:hypothetical protein
MPRPLMIASFSKWLIAALVSREDLFL